MAQRAVSRVAPLPPGAEDQTFDLADSSDLSGDLFEDAERADPKEPEPTQAEEPEDDGIDWRDRAQRLERQVDQLISQRPQPTAAPQAPTPKSISDQLGARPDPVQDPDGFNAYMDRRDQLLLAHGRLQIATARGEVGQELRAQEILNEFFAEHPEHKHMSRIVREEFNLATQGMSELPAEPSALIDKVSRVLESYRDGYGERGAPREREDPRTRGVSAGSRGRPRPRAKAPDPNATGPRTLRDAFGQVQTKSGFF